MNEFEDYKKEKLTIDIVWANVFGLLMLIPIALIYGVPFYIIWKSELIFSDIMKDVFGLFTLLKIIIVLIIGIIVHELIHGIVWAAFAKKGFKSIKFGVLWKMLTPYCHCKEPLKVKHYIIGGIAPAILMGFLPAMVSMFTGDIGMLFFGLFFTIAACGDFLIINLLRKEKPNDYTEDHPSEAGCFIYRK